MFALEFLGLGMFALELFALVFSATIWGASPRGRGKKWRVAEGEADGEKSGERKEGRGKGGDRGRGEKHEKRIGYSKYNFLVKSVKENLIIWTQIRKTISARLNQFRMLETIGP